MIPDLIETALAENGEAPPEAGSMGLGSAPRGHTVAVAITTEQKVRHMLLAGGVFSSADSVDEQNESSISVRAFWCLPTPIWVQGLPRS
jgi:hypothetical protein